MKIRIFLIVSAFFACYSGYANPSLWTELEFSKKIFKNFKAEFNPELRLLDNYKMDTYILEGGVSYKVHKYLTLAAYYRYENEWDYKKSTGAYKGQISSNRLAFDAKSGFNFKRFDFSFRLRYTNSGIIGNSDDNDEKSFFRYRAKVAYDIKKCKFVPNVSVEAFHDLINKEFTKYRYTAGIDYSINSKNEVGIFYRLQNYTEADKESLNILGVGYSFKF